MIAGRSALTVLVAAAVGVLLALVALPGTDGPTADPRAGPQLDRHTGAAVATTAALQRRIRGLGEAGSALGALRALDPATRAAPALARLEQLLAAELAAPSPAARPVAPPDQPTELVAWLALRDDDVETAATTESLFLHEAGLDGDAARLAARVRAASTGPNTAAACLDLARRFTDLGRTRARDRWLRRAYQLEPGSPETRRALASSLIEASRHRAALAVLGPAQPRDDLQLVALRADVSGWLGDHATEAVDRDTLADAAADATGTAKEPSAAAERAARLYEHLGEPLAALPHTERQARLDGSPAALHAAAVAAFAAGDHDRGFALLESALEQRQDPAVRGELAALALADLRLALAARHGLAGPAHRARLDDAAVAADFRAPDTEAIRTAPQTALQRVAAQIALQVSLGDRDAARALTAEVAGWPLEDARWFRWLDRFASAGIPHLDQLAAARVADRNFDVRALRPLLPILEADGSRWPATGQALRIHHLARPEVFAAVVRAWVDDPSEPGERLQRAARLRSLHPRSEPVARLVVDRAAWAGDRRAELTARDHLRGLRPLDLENRRRLVDLHTALGEPLHAAAEAVALVVLAPSPHPARRRTARLLAEAGLGVTARRLLAEELTAVDLSTAGLRETADTLFDLGAWTLARTAYERLDRVAGEDRHAAVRLGLVRAWTGDPEAALGPLRRALTADSAGLDRGTRRLAHHQLGEALWSLDARDAARVHFEAVLRSVALESTPLGRETTKTAAHALRRLGRSAAAAELLEDGQRRWPDDLPLQISRVEVLDEADQSDAADQLLARLLAEHPDHPDLLQVGLRRDAASGKPARQQRARSFGARLLAQADVDPQVHALLGELDLRQGHYRDALRRFQRWQALAPEDRRAADAIERAGDPLRGDLLVTGRWRAVAEDRTASAFVASSQSLTDALRLHARIGHSSWNGRSPAVDGGSRGLRAETVRFDATLEHATADGSRRLSGGLALFPGLDGDAPLGGFLAARFTSPGQHYRTLELRAGLGELWDDPAAAPALEGRRDSLEADGYLTLDDSSFAGAGLRLRQLSARSPVAGAGQVDDLQIDGQLTLGRTLSGDARPAVADRFRIDRSPALPPLLDLSLEERRVPRITSWLSWQSIHLLGDAGLPDLLPIGERFDYLLVGGRVEQVLAEGFGASLEGFAGYELHAEEPSFAVEGAALWQPTRRMQAALRAGWGRALGRADEDPDSFELFVEGRLRW